jgi:hypothetical protein
MRILSAALALLLLLSASSWAQISIVTTTTITCETPVPEGVKAAYAWYCDTGLTLTITGRSAIPSGRDGTYGGVVVATIDGVKTATPFEVTIGDTPAPVPTPETLRTLVTDSEANQIAIYLRVLAENVSDIKSDTDFNDLWAATFPVQGNDKLDAALKLMTDAALLKPLELSKSLLSLADEFGKPSPPEPEPEPPVVESGPRAVVIVHESGDNNPDFGALQVNLQRPNSTSQNYLKQAGHTLDILDTNLSGKWSEVVKGRVAGMALPVLFVIDPRTNEILFGTSIPNTYTADQVIERLRENGG